MGGDHKCPLCSATFTRPQHVGRHLRAHTGDRPYECKECPLRFARSDLLSRHVNKAHPKPDGAGGNKGKNDKRGRRKSVSSQNPVTGGIFASRPASHPPTAPQALPPPGPHLPEHTAFQAQRMYPNHPLLQQNNANSQPWAQSFSLGHANQFVTDPMGNLNIMTSNFSAPIGSEMSPVSQTYDPSLANPAPPLGLDLAVKKRACDQCNHSKVRCDCADPCTRCAHRSIQCTYTKQQRTRLGPSVSTNVDSVPNPLSGISPTSHRRIFGSDNAISRPPVPEPQWDAGIPQSMNATSDSTYGAIHQSPATLVMALTPALTNSTSPSSTDLSGSDRRSSTTSGGGTWMIPQNAMPHNFDYGGVQMDSIGLASSFHGSTNNLFRTRGDSGGYDASSASPNYEPTISSEDDDVSSTGWTEKDTLELQRRSSAGHWANAIDQLRLDDPQAQGLTIDANGNIQFPFQAPQRHGTFPIAPGELPANLSRAPSSQDVNFWKLFLDPAALASPDVQGDMNPSLETPRGLSKSNSMPDLKTPPTATAFYAPMQFPSEDRSMSIPTAPHMNANQQQPQPQQGSELRANSDDADLTRWRNHIQQRHASFSMNLSSSTAARKVTTGQLSAAMFASGAERFFRPPPNPLMSSSAMDQTLAPERTPSFLSAFDPTTPKGTPRTPTAQLLSMYSGFERPSNKRVASQTLVPEILQKRQQFAPDEETFTDSSNSSRRSSEQHAAFTHAHHRASFPSSLYQSQVAPAEMR